MRALWFALLAGACTEASPRAPSAPSAETNAADPPVLVVPEIAAPRPTAALVFTAPPAALATRGYIELDASQGELLPLVKMHVERAKSRGLVPYVEFFADWCPPCRALKKYKDDPRLAEAFRGTYVVALDVDAWQDKLKGTGFVPRTIPIFYAVDAEGRPTGRQITGDAWGKNHDTPDRMAPVLAAFFAADQGGSR